MKTSNIMGFLAFAACIAAGIIASACGIRSGTYKQVKKPVVAVSIPPQETFVRAVAGNLVETITLIPPGRGPESYSPTPRDMESFSRASIYFAIGVPAEAANILPRARDFNSNLKIVSLCDEVKKIYPEREFPPGSRDPHIWLSPKRVKVMVETIAAELGAADADNKAVYERNALSYLRQLDILDREIKSMLSGIENRTFIAYHPAFGYFADDYNLEMLSLEKEGKEATARDLQDMINTARKRKIKAIFYQAEIDSRQAEVFAREIGGKAVMVAPLAPDYIDNLRRMARTFEEILGMEEK